MVCIPYLGVGVLILLGISLTDAQEKDPAKRYIMRGGTDAQRQYLLRFPGSDADLAVTQDEDDYMGYYRLLRISALCFLGLVVYLIWTFVVVERHRRSYAAKKRAYHVRPERYTGLKVVCR
jgi:hypothetical protein